MMNTTMQEYKSKVTITAQAEYDRWAEASGMKRSLWELAQKAGVSAQQFRDDLDNAPIACDGGRW